MLRDIQQTAEDSELTHAGRKVYSGGGIEPDCRFDWNYLKGST